MAELMKYETDEIIIWYDGFDEWGEMKIVKVEVKDHDGRDNEQTNS